MLERGAAAQAAGGGGATLGAAGQCAQAAERGGQSGAPPRAEGQVPRASPHRQIDVLQGVQPDPQHGEHYNPTTLQP
eukprot:8241031-Pyramimonas_sp.AAC.2